MERDNNTKIRNDFFNFINNKIFPCVGAKTAISKNQLSCMVAGNIFCPSHDKEILSYLYSFIDNYQLSNNNFHSAAIIFTGPENITEEMYETAFWQRLQAISNIDAQLFGFDKRVSSDIDSPLFSFSIKEEAMFVVGMHAASSREARRFAYPAIIFNPHEQFDVLKRTNKYKSLQSSIRKRDIAFSGSINPMLNDHAITPEIVQYSGKNYGNQFTCPLKINHGYI
jgi:uncharacterized protein